MYRVVLGVVLAAVITLAGLSAGGAPTATADAPVPVGAHRHFILVNGDKVYVGPNFCDVAATKQGFAGFHHKVHLTDPGLVDVRSEGCGA